MKGKVLLIGLLVLAVALSGCITETPPPVTNFTCPDGSQVVDQSQCGPNISNISDEDKQILENAKRIALEYVKSMKEYSENNGQEVIFLSETISSENKVSTISLFFYTDNSESSTRYHVNLKVKDGAITSAVSGIGNPENIYMTKQECENINGRESTKKNWLPTRRRLYWTDSSFRNNMLL